MTTSEYYTFSSAWRKRFYLFLFVALAHLAVFATTVEGQSVKSLDVVLTSEGTLNQEVLAPGSYDANGYRLDISATGAPRFIASNGNTGDEHWDDRFGFPGVGWDVFALAVSPNGDVYVGGNFQTAGAVPAVRIARWDGRRFYSLGGGVDGEVRALAVAPDGALYAGGSFSRAGDVAARSIARWDGSAWHPVGGGIMSRNGYPIVNAISISGSKVYVGGEFDKAGNVNVTNLAVWDGSTWSDVGGGVGNLDWENNFEPGGEVYAITIDGNNVYVGGRFKATASLRRWILGRIPQL